MVQENKKLDNLKKTLAEEIEKAAPVKLSTPSINQMIESHSTYKDYKLKIEEKKLTIELLEKSEKTFNSATFDIKNLVEIMKLETT
jgi:hypothetical protein